MQSIGWIGVGIMGGPMVRNLLKAGFEVHITARNRAKVEEVIQAGAVFHDTIAGCVQGRQAVVTMVGYPQDVEEVYFAPGNILDQAAPGTYLIDMTTTSPTLAQRLAVEGAKRYETPETAAFINGILGSFVRGELPPERAKAPAPAAEEEA